MSEILYPTKFVIEPFKMGYASAQAWIMLVIALAIILVLFKLFRFHESEIE